MFCLCAVLGQPEAAKLVYLMLHTMQHRMKRRKECHILSATQEQVFCQGGEGPVQSVFTEAVLGRLPGEYAVGIGGALPGQTSFWSDQLRGTPCILAVGGSIFSSGKWREERGLPKISEAELWMSALLAGYGEQSYSVLMRELLRRHQGVYSVMMLAGQEFTVVRDPWGFLPMWQGKLSDDSPGLVFATELCALDLVGAGQRRELAPGEWLRVEGEKGETCQSEVIFPVLSPQHCSFAQIYGLRPDSVADGKNAVDVRFAIGKKLATKLPAGVLGKHVVVAPVPDSGQHVAEGVAGYLDVSPQHPLLRNHYLGPGLLYSLHAKFSVIKEAVDERIVVLVDDSLIEGEVLPFLVGLLRGAGAKQVHALVGAKVTRACPVHLAFDGKKCFVAATMSDEQILQASGADSIAFLDPSEVSDLLGPDYCYYCLGLPSPVFSE